MATQLTPKKIPDSATLPDTIPEVDTSQLTLPKDNLDSQECENCHAVLEGSFCSNCGQSKETSLKYFWTVILHLLDDIFSFDSRASRTLTPLLFRPAFLTNEYFAGRRVHYVPPLRLYLFVSICFFLSLKFFAEINISPPTTDAPNVSIEQLTQSIEQLETESLPSDSDVIILQELKQLKQDIEQSQSKVLSELSKKLAFLVVKQQSSSTGLSDDELKLMKSFREGIEEAKSLLDSPEGRSKVFIGNTEEGDLKFDFLAEETNAKLNHFAKEVERKAEYTIKNDPAKLVESAISKLPQLMFVLLPLFALILKIVMIFYRRLYMEHLTVALHSHSFIFVVILLAEILGKISEQTEASAPFVSKGAILVIALLMVWIPIYLFIMQKRVYKQGGIAAIFTYFVISTLYALLLAFTATVAFIWGAADL